MAKETIGSMISLGIYGIIGVFAAIGLLFGLKRGFSKTVIRFATILASAVGAYFVTSKFCNMLSTYLTGSDAPTVDALIESILPGTLGMVPDNIRPIISELGTETASIFLMMFVCLALVPIIFISVFFLLKAVTFLVYLLLAGLAGIVSYRKGLFSTVFGGVAGIMLGALIGCIILVPFTGLFSLLETSREALVETPDDPDADVVAIYANYLDDVLDNPILDTVRGWGGEYIYNGMVTVQISDRKINMAEEAKELFRLAIDVKPLTEGFNWEDPSPEHREALTILVNDINDNDLVASLMSDLLRGTAVAVESGAFEIPMDGPLGMIAHDTLAIFKTSTRDNIGEDLDIILDVYFIMCDDGILVALKHGDEDIITNLFSEVKPDGKTAIVHITDRLSESERSKVIVSSLTKISVSLIQGSLGLDEEQTQLYEDVKEDFRDILNHNKSDYETEEEYREAISNDFDKALEENNITLSDEIKNDMLDYIADNFSETPEITDDDINNALLSYFASQAGNLGNLPGGLPGGLPGILPGIGGDSTGDSTNTPEGDSNENPGNTGGSTDDSSDIPESDYNDTPGRLPEDDSDEIPDEIPDIDPDDIPDDILNQLPDGFLDGWGQ